MSFETRPGSTAPTSRKVVASYFVSLDGVAEGADQFLTGWDDEVDAAGAKLIATQDTVVLGRRTYDEWSQFWPSSDIEPFASFVNAVPKYVVTSSALGAEWANSHVIDGEPAEFVRDLKAKPGGDIGIHGSISVTRALLTAGLLDELKLVVVPTVVGSGRQLLTGLPPVRLETVHCTQTPSGYLLVDYRVMP